MPLTDLVGAQIEPQDKLRVRLIGEPIRIDPQVAQPLSIVLHELAANAAHHGALSNLDGGIEIAWQRDRGRNLLMSWVEQGGPTPRESGKAGFGTAIMKGVLERQLGATVTQDWLTGGLKIDLDIPNAAIDA